MQSPEGLEDSPFNWVLLFGPYVLELTFHIFGPNVRTEGACIMQILGKSNISNEGINQKGT